MKIHKFYKTIFLFLLLAVVSSHQVMAQIPEDETQVGGDVEFAIPSILPSIDAEPDGGIGKFIREVSNYASRNYPKKYRKSGKEGSVYVQFVVEKDGSLINIKIADGFDQETFKKLLEEPFQKVAIDAVKNQTHIKWKPAFNELDTVRQSFTIPVNFKAPLKKQRLKTKEIKTKEVTEDEIKVTEVTEEELDANIRLDVTSLVDVSAVPEIGMSKYYSRIHEYVSYYYPNRSLKGKVYLSFIVEKTGDISTIKVIRGLNQECDLIAIEAIKSLLYIKWIPATKNGEKVNQVFYYSVSFNL